MDGPPRRRSDPFAPTPHRRPCASSPPVRRAAPAALALVSCRPLRAEQPVQPPAARATRSCSGELAGHRGPARRLGPGAAARSGQADTEDDYFHPRLRGPQERSASTPSTACAGRAPARWRATGCGSRARRAPAGGGDGHMAVVQPDRWEYDFWQVRDRPAGGGTLVVSHGGRTMIDGDGLGSDATAAEFGLAAGLIRGDQIQAGKIDHALFVHVRCTNGRSVYPAAPGTTGTICSGHRPNAPPLGARIWLDLSDAQIAALPVPRLEEDGPARAPPLRRLRGRHDRRQRLLGPPDGLRLHLHELRRGRPDGERRAGRCGSSAGTAPTTSTWTAAWTGRATCGWWTRAWRRGPARSAGNATFTSASPGDHKPCRARADTQGMDERGRILFVGVVTCYLLGRLFGGRRHAPPRSSSTA